MGSKVNSPNKKIERNIWIVYIQSIITQLGFFLPIIVLFWQENGLDFTQIMLLQSLYSIAVVFLEVPTGYFADLFSRKRALTLASIFLASGMLIYSLGHNFFMFLLAEIVWAIGVALMSGCDSALVYDTLLALGRKTEYKKIMGKALFYGFLSIAAGSILGGIIGRYDYRWTFYAFIPFLLLLFPLSLAIHEPERKKFIHEKGHFKQMLKIARSVFSENEKLRWLVIYSAIILGFNQASLWFYQPYMQLGGVDIIYFGAIFASFQIVAAISSKYANDIEQKLGQKYSIMLLAVLLVGSFFLMSSFVFLFSFSFVFLQQFVRGFGKVVISDYVNQETKSDVRATVLSVNNLGARIVYATIIPFLGWTADKYSILEALMIAGILAAVFGLLILFILKEKKVI
jgi:MFS family permease